MATKGAHKRLTREYQNFQKSPPPYIDAHPSENNILEWHYLLTGAPDTPYAGGQYWGTLIFPPDYPFAPPAIRMHTASGRFTPSTRLCLSISDYHPKSFNPAWSVSTILIGLQSFMNGDEVTTGSMNCSPAERRYLAARSRWANSTGKGTLTKQTAGNNIGKGGSGNANIKAGDGGSKFKQEWPEEDAENWKFIDECRIDPATGKILPDPEGEVLECSIESARLRKILGGGSTAGIVQVAREADGWQLGRYRWWAFGAVLLYLVVSKMVVRNSAAEAL